MTLTITNEIKIAKGTVIDVECHKLSNEKLFLKINFDTISTCTMNAQNRENFVHETIDYCLYKPIQTQYRAIFFLIKKVSFCNKVNNYCYRISCEKCSLFCSFTVEVSKCLN